MKALSTEEHLTKHKPLVYNCKIKKMKDTVITFVLRNNFENS